MDSHLMEKEVLCILDTRQIQRFMFRSNAYVDTLGGSDLMTHILEDGMRFALQSIEPPLRKEEYDLSLDPDAPIPYFENDEVLFQLMICAAGNAMFLARIGRLAQKLIRKISGSGVLFGGRFLITVSISVLVMDLLRFSISPWFSF